VQTQHRLIASLTAAALLAACSSGGSSPSIPSGPQSSVPSSFQQGASPQSMVQMPVRAFVDETGRPVASTHVMSIFGGVSTATAAATNLLYHGGPVQTKPTIYVVFWHYKTDPDSVRPTLVKFLKGVGGSSWLGTVTQYYMTSGTTKTHIANTTGELVATWGDTAGTMPNHPTDAQVQAEAERAAQHFGVSTVNASIVVATPHLHNTNGFATQWCAYHGYTSTGIAYTNLPYMPDGKASCGAGTVNSPGTDDGVTIVEGHELAETQTDPQAGNGWLDSSGAEIGDKCAWVSLQNTSFSTGSFPTQPLWSNKVKGCVQ
jgi:hypothetical protein